MKTRLRALETTVGAVLHTRSLSPDLTVPGAREHIELVRRLLAESIASGAEHGGKMLARATRQDRFAARIIDLAIEWMNSMSALAGKWNRDMDAAVIQVINNALTTRASLNDTMAALRVVFNGFADHRLEAIARTEATAAFNHGILLAYKDEDEVVAFQWLAILDSRTCPLCRSRDGMIILKTNPNLDEMVPPAHCQCRCILVPVLRAEYDALRSDDPDLQEEAERLIFEPAMDPQTLEEALDWKDVPLPMPGFGGTSGADYKRPKPKPRPPAAPPKPLPPLQPAEVEEIRRRAADAVTEKDSAAFLLWILLLIRKHREEAGIEEEEDNPHEETIV